MDASGDRSTDPGPLAVGLAFLRLGLTSFGGPLAHLGYYRREFVDRRRWLTEPEFAELVSLCQFLPGPASSQIGVSVGLLRGGAWGALAAWLAFTLPSAAAMLWFARASAIEGPIARGALHGLKLVAVAVVAEAVWRMARALSPDARRIFITIVAAVIATMAGSAAGQTAAMAAGAGLGLLLCHTPTSSSSASLRPPISRGTGAVLLGIFMALLVALPVVTAVTASPLAAAVDAFYRSGALVFGGGHVVLPLLEEAMVAPGWVSRDDFLAGYGAAQALPGPLFAFAAYLGAVMTPSAGAFGPVVCLVAIFLPGLLLVIGVLPFWNAWRARRGARTAVAGINAAVVGVLLAAWINPVLLSSVRDSFDSLLVAAGFLLLVRRTAPPLVVVALLTGVGTLRAL